MGSVLLEISGERIIRGDGLKSVITVVSSGELSFCF